MLSFNNDESKNSNRGRLPRVCVIGAGCSGMTATKSLKDRGIPVTCYEKGSDIGGLWRFGNDNGMSSVYKSLHINTHRDRMEFADYPMPPDYPDYPSHKLIWEYFKDYAGHFGLYENIVLNTGVKRVERREDGVYEVLLDNGGIEYFDAVIVANGHHWSERWPDPYPGKFSGKEIHAHRYVDPSKPLNLSEQNVMVVGMGNSAMDIAVEISRPGLTAKTILSGRRGAYVWPKYIFGKPFDKLTLLFPPWVPFAIKRFLATLTYRLAVGKMTDFGLPEPDHKLGHAHPTISNEILGKLGSGDIQFRPGIKEFAGRTVRFVDGSEEDVDVIIWCTGYNVSFPFFDDQFFAATDNRLPPLFHRAIQPGMDDLFFVGLLQPLGAVMPLSEAQGKWIAEQLCGEYALPTEQEMRKFIDDEMRAMNQRYVSSARHTMQVDFEKYLYDLEREVKRGRRRADQNGNALPIEARAHLHKGTAARKTKARGKKKASKRKTTARMR